MNRGKKVCEHCGASMQEYRHSLNLGLLEGLLRLYKAAKPVNLRDLLLTRSQWDNFQKLRYWDLVQKHREGGIEKGGIWEITERGRDFVLGRVTVPRQVRTYRGERVGFEGDQVAASEIHDVFQGFKKAPEYRRESSPHPEPGGLRPEPSQLL